MDPNPHDKWRQWSSSDYAAAELHERQRRRMADREETDLHRIAESADPFHVLTDRAGEAYALACDALGEAASIIAGTRAKRRGDGRRAAMARGLVKVRRMIEAAGYMCADGKADAYAWAERYPLTMPPGSGPGFALLFEEIASIAEDARRDLRHAFNVWEPEGPEAALAEILS